MTTSIHPHYRKRGRATGNDDDVAERESITSFPTTTGPEARLCHARAREDHKAPSSERFKRIHQQIYRRIGVHQGNHVVNTTTTTTSSVYRHLKSFSSSGATSIVVTGMSLRSKSLKLKNPP